MTAVQDMHIDLMHVLYVYIVYNRVMGVGGIITKYNRGAGTYCICGILDL